MLSSEEEAAGVPTIIPQTLDIMAAPLFLEVQPEVVVVVIRVLQPKRLAAMVVPGVNMP